MTAGRRPLYALVGAVAAASTAYIAVWIVSSLAVLQITGSAAAGGSPAAVAVLATALGVVLVSGLGIRFGRLRGLAVGFGAAIIGSALAVVAVVLGSLAWLLIASAALGLGNSALQQTRYAAADLVPDDRRAWAVGLAVWGSTVGAVVGPNLLGPAQALAGFVSLDPLVVGLAIVGVGFVAALAATMLARHWQAVAGPVDRPSAERPGIAAPGWWHSVAALFRTPSLRAAVAALIGGQVAMVMIMTMTPLHIHEGGGDLVLVGLVISAHTLGMFALAPLSAWLVERRGPHLVALGGMVVIGVAAVLAAVAPVHAGPVLALALFLLGYGWNMCFVAGSSMLTHGLAGAGRIALQGSSDFLVYLVAAVASISSGALLAAGGFALLSVLGGALLVIPAAVIVREWMRAPEPAGI